MRREFLQKHGNRLYRDLDYDLAAWNSRKFYGYFLRHSSDGCSLYPGEMRAPSNQKGITPGRVLTFPFIEETMGKYEKTFLKLSISVSVNLPVAFPGLKFPELFHLFPD